jgi:hypothetical protein
MHSKEDQFNRLLFYGRVEATEHKLELRLTQFLHGKLNQDECVYFDVRFKNCAIIFGNCEKNIWKNIKLNHLFAVLGMATMNRPQNHACF